MEKKIMTLFWHYAIEADQASVYRVTPEDFERLAIDLQSNAETDDLPRLELRMCSEKEWEEFQRIGDELA